MSRFSDENPAQAGEHSRFGLTFPRTPLGQVLELTTWIVGSSLLAGVIAVALVILFGQR